MLFESDGRYLQVLEVQAKLKQKREQRAEEAISTEREREIARREHGKALATAERKRREEAERRTVLLRRSVQ